MRSTLNYHKYHRMQRLLRVVLKISNILDMHDGHVIKCWDFYDNLNLFICCLSFFYALSLLIIQTSNNAFAIFNIILLLSNAFYCQLRKILIERNFSDNFRVSNRFSFFVVKIKYFLLNGTFNMRRAWKVYKIKVIKFLQFH